MIHIIPIWILRDIRTRNLILKITIFFNQDFQMQTQKNSPILQKFLCAIKSRITIFNYFLETRKVFFATPHSVGLLIPTNFNEPGTRFNGCWVSGRDRRSGRLSYRRLNCVKFKVWLLLSRTNKVSFPLNVSTVASGWVFLYSFYFIAPNLKPTALFQMFLLEHYVSKHFLNVTSGRW